VAEPVRHGHRRTALAVMTASGFAGLGYQLVWTQQCTAWLGHEAAAILAVVGAFFGGLALGSLALGRLIERSPTPQRWYAACELVIAGWSLALSVLLAPVGGWMLALIGEQPSAPWQWAVGLAGTFVLLLPATAAMGATLPAMERTLAHLEPYRRTIAALYASNTSGAVLGVLATAFWMIPAVGLVRTAMACAVLNVACAAMAWRLRPDTAPPGPSIAPTSPTPATSPTQRAAGATLALLACTGGLGIGYEVLVVRVLSQVTEDTVYTFALLLAVYLLGTAAGAAAYHRWLAHRDDFRTNVLRDRLLCGQALACLAGIATLWGAEELRRAAEDLVGDGLVGALTGETTLALAAFLAPTFVMGALFSHLTTRARAAGIGMGAALAANTVGAAFAPLAFGVLLAPAIGPKAALLIVVAAYLALGLPRLRSMPLAWAGGVGLAALALAAPPLAFVDMPEGARLVSYREGALAAVSVVEDGRGVATLRINNRQQEGSSATRLADARQAFLPLLLHESPRDALFLGLGTGVTASAAAEDRALRVDAVELLPEVVAASAFFEDGAANPRPHVVAADARRYVRTTSRTYDVIVADNFHPARSGSGALYTVEHFRAVRDRLSARGVFCQWLPLHQLDLDTLRSIVRSFVAVHPHASAMLATNSLQTPVLGLVARRDDRPFDLGALRRRLSSLRPARPLADYGLVDEWSAFGAFVAGPQSLARFAGDAAINTDDRPIVAYRAPRITYAPSSAPGERLVALLAELAVAPDDLIDGADAQWSRRLAAYWAARDRFVEAGRHVSASNDARRMLEQVREPLLEVLRISPDFRPAYDPLLRLAAELARSDPAQSRRVLAELAMLQPSRIEASQLLDRLPRP
jgi:spermidine synthase